MKTNYSNYITRQNPASGLWHACGHAGGKYWLPCSESFESREEADKWGKTQLKVDTAARNLVARSQFTIEESAG